MPCSGSGPRASPRSGFTSSTSPACSTAPSPYARAESLTPAQLAYLAAEGYDATPPLTPAALLEGFARQVDRALAQLRATDVGTLAEAREVGRARLPSTVLGLLVHAAEHTMRHVGQLSVTARVLRG